MGKRRTRYTEEQRAARDAADAAICDSAAELLADPDAVAAMVTQLMNTTSPKLLRYSMRNVTMLTKQAEERGMPLTDVDSFRGWIERGRCVRKGETGLRIVAPKGTETDPDQDTGEDQAEPQPGDDAEAPRVRFRMVTVFDVSQTEGIEDAEPAETEAITDPAAVLRATITEQIERMGYTITTADQAEGTATVDDHTVTVPAGQPVPELAQALASLLSRPKSDRPKAKPATVRNPADPNTPQRVRLPLGDDYGTAAVTVRTDWTTGRAFYEITAPRVTGTWTVSIDDPADTEHVARLNVDYGEDDGRSWYSGYGQGRPNRPKINGVSLVGGTHGIAADSLDTLRRWQINCQRPTGRYTSCSAPDRTTERMAAILRAILRHFTARPDLNELHRAAARVAAATRKHEEAQEVVRLEQEIQNLTAKRDQHAQRSERFAALADDCGQLDLFTAC